MSKDNSNLRLLGSPVNLSYRSKRKDDRKLIRNRPRSALQNSCFTPDTQESYKRPFSADAKERGPSTRAFFKTFSAELLQSYNNSPKSIKVLPPTADLLGDSKSVDNQYPKNERDVCSNASDYGSEDTFISLGTKIKAKAQVNQIPKVKHSNQRYHKYRNLAKRNRKGMDAASNEDKASDYGLEVKIKERSRPQSPSQGVTRCLSPSFKTRAYESYFVSLDEEKSNPLAGRVSFGEKGVEDAIDVYSMRQLQTKQQLSLVEEESAQDLESVPSSNLSPDNSIEEHKKKDVNETEGDLTGRNSYVVDDDDTYPQKPPDFVAEVKSYKRFYNDFCPRSANNNYTSGNTIVHTDSSSKDSGYPSSANDDNQHAYSLPTTSNLRKSNSENKIYEQPKSLESVSTNDNDQYLKTFPIDKKFQWTEPLNHSRLLYKDFFLKKEGHMPVPPKNSPSKSDFYNKIPVSHEATETVKTDNKDENLEYPTYLLNSSTKAYTSKVIEDYKKELEAINNLHVLTIKDMQTDAISPTPLNIDKMFEQYSSLPEDKKEDVKLSNSKEEIKNNNTLDMRKKDVDKLSTKELIQNYLKVKGGNTKEFAKNLKKFENIETKRKWNNRTPSSSNKNVPVNQTHKNLFTMRPPLSARIQDVQNDKDVDSWMSLSAPSQLDEVCTPSSTCEPSLENKPKTPEEPAPPQEVKEIKPLPSTTQDLDTPKPKELNANSSVLDIYSMLKEIESFGDNPVTSVTNVNAVDTPKSEVKEERSSTPKDNFLEIFEFLEKVEKSANDALSVVSSTTPQTIPQLESLLQLPATELAQRLVTAALQLEERACCVALLQESLARHKEQVPPALLPALSLYPAAAPAELAQRLVTAALQLEERACCVALLQESLARHKEQVPPALLPALSLYPAAAPAELAQRLVTAALQLEERACCVALLQESLARHKEQVPPALLPALSLYPAAAPAELAQRLVTAALQLEERACCVALLQESLARHKEQVPPALLPALSLYPAAAPAELAQRLVTAALQLEERACCVALLQESLARHKEQVPPALLPALSLYPAAAPAELAQRLVTAALQLEERACCVALLQESLARHKEQVPPALLPALSLYPAAAPAELAQRLVTAALQLEERACCVALLQESLARHKEQVPPALLPALSLYPAAAPAELAQRLVTAALQLEERACCVALLQESLARHKEQVPPALLPALSLYPAAAPAELAQRLVTAALQLEERACCVALLQESLARHKEQVPPALLPALSLYPAAAPAELAQRLVTAALQLEERACCVALLQESLARHKEQVPPALLPALSLYPVAAPAELAQRLVTAALQLEERACCVALLQESLARHKEQVPPALLPALSLYPAAAPAELAQRLVTAALQLEERACCVALLQESLARHKEQVPPALLPALSLYPAAAPAELAQRLVTAALQLEERACCVALLQESLARHKEQVPPALLPALSLYPAAAPAELAQRLVTAALQLEERACCVALLQESLARHKEQVPPALLPALSLYPAAAPAELAQRLVTAALQLEERACCVALLQESLARHKEQVPPALLPALSLYPAAAPAELAQRLVTAALQLEERACCVALLQESLARHKEQVPPALLPALPLYPAAAPAELAQRLVTAALQLEERACCVAMISKVSSLEKQSLRNVSKVKQDCEEAIKRHQTFIDQLINDKKTLNHRIEQLVDERRALEDRWKRSAQALEERYQLELRNQRDKMAAAQQVARQRWVRQKAEKIKELTVKGLEGELREMADRQQKEIADLKMAHAEHCGRLQAKHNQDLEDLRRSLHEEHQAALTKERHLASSRLEKQMLELELTYQEQRTRLVAEMRAENERAASGLSERERAQRESCEKWKEEQEKLLEQKKQQMEQEIEKQREHMLEQMKLDREELEQEFEQHKRDFEVEQRALLKKKETEIAAQYRQERDREIERAIESMEAEAQAGRRELQDAMRRSKEQFELERRELARTEHATLRRFQDAQARARHAEDRCAELEITITQLETRNKVITEKNSQLEASLEQIRESCELAWRQKVEGLQRDAAQARKTHEEQMHQLYAKVKVAVARKDSAIQALTREAARYQEKITILEQKLQQQRKDYLKQK